jgi:hypothetical protein
MPCAFENTVLEKKRWIYQIIIKSLIEMEEKQLTPAASLRVLASLIPNQAGEKKEL